MAPALSDRDREPAYVVEAAGGARMDDRGAGFLRDPHEMERILGELSGSADLAQVDFLQVMKTIEGGGGGGDADADSIFPLVAPEDFLAEDAVRQQEEADAAGARERIAALQRRVERRCEFLRRRLRLRQARAAGRHAGEEAAAGWERAARGRARGLTRTAARALLDRLGSEAALPRREPAPQPPAPPCPGLASAAGALRSHLTVLERHLDSDATASSSGAESADETVAYGAHARQTMPITKRAMWKWTQERASIASRWTWLQAQIQELEYKIRQHSELERRIRVAKGTTASCEPSGYTGPLPGEVTECSSTSVESCARSRPINSSGFKKRKLLQMHNLHTAAEKAAKPSTIRCICQWPLGGCAVCTGRALPMHPLPLSSTLTKQERLALVDPAYHPVLSSLKEVSTSAQYSAKMKNPQWQQRGSRNPVKSFKGNATPMSKLPQVPSKMLLLPNKSHSKKKKHSKSKRGRTNTGPMELGRSIQARRRTSVNDGNREGIERGGKSPHGDNVPFPSGSSSPVPSPSDYRHRPRTDRTRLNSAYDIDNIVIPHSIAANTKLEILQYKEILTPKWRIVDSDEMPVTPNNGIIKKAPVLLPEEKAEDVEDVSEPTVLARHARCEEQEKGKYLQKRKSSRRQHSRSGTGSNHPLTPSETPPHTPSTMMDETSMHSESGMTSVATVTSGALSNILQATTSTNISTPSTSNLIVNSQIHDSVSSLPSISQLHPSMTGNNKRRLTLQMDEIEIIPPYSPRDFPLSEETYTKMLIMMPDNHPLSMADTSSQHHSTPCNNGSDSESNSAISYPVRESSVMEVADDTIIEQPSDSEGDSCSVPPDEDPNDPEWNASAHTD